MNTFQDIFDAQKALFATGVTRTYEWRVDQLDRMARMIKENEGRFQKAMAKDFKTASQEYIFETAASAGETEVQKSQLKEWMKPVEAPVPRFLAETGHKGMIYREPYGVALIIGPFNGPLLLLIRPALAALAAGNTCILTLSEALAATTKVLLELVPKYFDPSAVTAVAGGKEQNTELLKLSFDFIFFTGSTFVGKVVARAAAENLIPVLLELGGMNPAVVDETANIPDAAKKIVWGAMAWGGQWCTSPGYAYIHESVADAFVAEAKKALVELFGDDPKSNSDYSRIINAHAVDRLASFIDPRQGDRRRQVRSGCALPRSYASLSHHLGRQGHGGRGLRADPADPDLQIPRRGVRADRGHRASACGFHLQLRPEDHRSVRRRAVLRWGRGEPGERSPVRRDHAVRRHRTRWDGPLLRQVWLRRAHPRQVDTDLPARRRDRPPVLALHRRKEPGASRVV